MKNKDKRQTKTAIRSGIFSASIIIFILLVGGLYWFNSKVERSNIINSYRNQQAEELRIMSSVIYHLYEKENSDELVNLYLASFPSSGNRFLVYSKDGQIVYAKNRDATASLGAYVDEDDFFDALTEENLCIASENFEALGHSFEIFIVSTEDYILDSADYETTSRYMQILMLLLAMALLTVVEFIVNAWNKVENKYEMTSEELKKRNNDLEVISQARTDGEILGEKILDPDGISNDGTVEFYNVYTMKALVDKAKADPSLLPLNIVKIQVDVYKANVSRELVYQYMGKIKDSLKGYEVMGEIMNGVFLVYIFRVKEETAFNEFNRIKTMVEEIQKKGLSVSVEMLKNIDSIAFDELT